MGLIQARCGQTVGAKLVAPDYAGKSNEVLLSNQDTLASGFEAALASHRQWWGCHWRAIMLPYTYLKRLKSVDSEYAFL